MKRWSATLLVFAVCTAVVHADVTVVQTTTVTGGAAAMAGASAPSPVMTSRIKGLKSRMDIDVQGMSISTIADLVAHQVIMLRHDQKTAHVISSAAGAAAAANDLAPAGIPPVKMDSSIAPTGKSQVIDGIKCDEYAFSTTMSLGEMSGGQMPPEAAEMLKDVSMVMKGSLWVAKDVPGAAEYLAFQKEAAKSDIANAALSAGGMKIPGMDKMMKAMSSVNGMAYMTEMNMTIEGSGPMVEMMRQMGAMTITTRTTSIKADPISDDLFKVPEGYSVIK